MSNPVICYENLMESADTVTATSEATGFPKENAYDWRTDSFWRPTSTGNYFLTMDMGSATAADYGAIYAHDLHTQGATIQLQSADDVGFLVNPATDVNITPTTSAPLIRTFGTKSRRFWRWRISGASSPPSIGVLSFGARLDSPEPVGVPFSPPTFARQPKVMTNRAEEGAFVGRRIQRKGVDFSLDLRFLTPAWIRSNWGSFQDHFETKPFFLAWDPGNYEDEAVFCWTTGKVAAPRYTQAQFMAVQLRLKGLTL